MSNFIPNPEKPKKLLGACPAYQPSPLIKTNAIANIDLLIKDESQRMGLGSFKALGGVYAVAILLAEKWQEKTGKKLSPEGFLSDEFKQFAASITFICASAGNHGLAVASGARLFGAKARIHLSAEVPKAFEQRLLTKSATVIWSGKVYDDSVEAAKQDANNGNGFLLADGSWEGYTYPPSLVMEGYTVIAEELKEEFTQSKKWPTHVFLQAGVGGLAAAIAYMIRHNWEQQPDIIIVEPDQAPCLQASHQNGKVTTVSGDISVMGRLDCKAPSLLAFNTLEKSQVHYTTISDQDAIKATQTLQQNNIYTTPSGAAGLAGLLKYQQLESNKNTFSDNRFFPLIIVTEEKIEK
jgi:diaminopropionate ammonia-lyase